MDSLLEIRRKAQQTEGAQSAYNAQRRAETRLEPHGGQKAEEHTQQAQPALKREYVPFTGIDAKRDYRAMYRAACNYHEQHNPPRLAGALEYWKEAADDMAEVAYSFNNDPFIIGLLCAVYDELEQEYKQLEAKQRQR